MKNLVLITLLLLAVNVFSQVAKKSSRPQCDFAGIGIFKIGIDTTILYNYANTHMDDIKNCSEFEDLQEIKDKVDDDTKTHLLRLFKSELASVTQSYCSNVIEFYVSRYEVAGVVIKNIHLKFFKNQLVEFSSDLSTDITDALTAKYGKPTLKVTKETSYCMHNLTGIKTPLEAKTFSSEWYNKDISAYADIYDHYDDHCQKSTRSFFLYSVDNKEWDNCEHVGLNKEINKSPKIEKSKLKDF